MKNKLLFSTILLHSFLIFSQSVSRTILLLPDTGQTSSYTSTFGEDHDYSINTPAFTNLFNGTIVDNITGLMWQQVDGGEMTHENAIIYCDNLVLGGFTDWRLPTPMESFSILNHQNSNPAINTNYFSSSNTPGAEYWWTSVFENNSTTKVWCTNSGGGIGNHPKSETISAGGTKRFNVRAVRTLSSPIFMANHFTDNNDGSITDNLTQLVWQKIPNPNVLTWEQALVYAEGLSLGTASDWRLPNIKELQSINNEGATNPSVFSTYFSNLGVHNFWSSTSLPNQTTKAWYWNTQFGITTYDLKTNTNYVLCVRGNPILTSNEFIAQNDIKVFPNPTSNYVLVAFPKEINLVQIEMTDAFGKIVFSKEIKPISNEFKLDVQGFSEGIYFINVLYKNSKSTFKIVIKK